MRLFSFLSVLVLLLTATSCGKHLTVSYSDNPSYTGTLHLLPARPLNKACLVVNEKLLVDRKFIRKITVTNLPAAMNGFHLTCDNFNLREKVDQSLTFKMEQNQEITRLIEVPPLADGPWIYSGLSFLGLAGMMTAVMLSEDEE